MIKFALIGVLLTSTTEAQTILHDDFNGSAFSPAWIISTPFSDSSASVNAGNATLENRGRLLTSASMPSAIDIAGRFEFTGNYHDSFQVVTRTDGVTSNPVAEFDHGIGFGFSIGQDSGNTTDNIWISHKGYPGTAFDLTRGTFSITLNTYYDFRITDDGNNVALYINDLVDPFLTGSDSAVFGSQVGLFNREGSGGGSSISAGSITAIDYINITTIPEPACAVILVGGFVIMSLSRVSRRNIGNDNHS